MDGFLGVRKYPSYCVSYINHNLPFKALELRVIIVIMFIIVTLLYHIIITITMMTASIKAKL